MLEHIHRLSTDSGRARLCPARSLDGRFPPFRSLGMEAPCGLAPSIWEFVQECEMAKTIGCFDYDIYGGPVHEPGRHPTSPIVEIYVKTWSQSEGGTPVISPHLMTEREIDWHIHTLKEDLDALCVAAKKALRKRHPSRKLLN